MRQQGGICKTSKRIIQRISQALISLPHQWEVFIKLRIPEGGRDSAAYMLVERYASAQCLHSDSIREQSRAADLPFSRAGNHNLLLI
jgi:hypothetical protein